MGRCVRPLSAWRDLGSGAVFFGAEKKNSRPLVLRCGQCIDCRLEKSRQWAVRCMHETQMHDVSSFVTLTYRDEDLPERGSLCYRDFQLFMKRLRKQQDARFFMCGEYGDKGRPHYHACLFGVAFGDRRLFKRGASGSDLFVSARLDELWPHGFCSVGDVTFESAAYVARYVCKKVTGPMAADHYRRFDPATGEVFYLTPEFARMSLKPGVGALWFERYRTDVFPHDYVIVRGQKARPPRYYMELLKRAPDTESDDVEFNRWESALSLEDDSSEDRLRVREAVTRARLAFKQRKLE